MQGVSPCFSTCHTFGSCGGLWKLSDRAQTGLNGTRTNHWRQSQAPVCFNRGSKTHPGLRPWGWGSTMQMQGALTCRQFPGAGSGCPACAHTRPADRRPGSRHRAAGGCPTEGLGRKRTPHHSVRGRLPGRQMGSPSSAAPRWSRPAHPHHPGPGGLR